MNWIFEYEDQKGNVDRFIVYNRELRDAIAIFEEHYPNHTILSIVNYDI